MSNARIRHKRRRRALRAKFFAPAIPATVKRPRQFKRVDYESMSARRRRAYRKKYPMFSAWLRAVGGVWSARRAGLQPQRKERR